MLHGCMPAQLRTHSCLHVPQVVELPERSAARAVQRLHKRHMQHRYIEVYLCESDKGLPPAALAKPQLKPPSPP